ncbi:MAG: galactose oxidase [Candidatus Eremiobacteraeota bacterium]|nr:galactose oxidase [Candidatus Eremiobacteraeota bacterium]MBV8499390.1 galactose oxidase [Candidatus Eremiobacteraeota bacterium]
MIRLLPAAVVLIAAVSLPGSWSAGPPLPVARSEVAVATIVVASVERMYVIGGYANGNVDQSLVEVFTPSAENGEMTGTWRDVAPLPRGLNHVGAVGYHGKVYTFGGFSSQNNAAVADANVYDPASNRWSPIAPLPHALGSVSVVALGDEIHLVGGRDVHSVTTHLVYDPATNRYSSRAPLSVGRDHMGLVAYDDRLYAIGGRIDTPAHNTAYVDIYDPRTNEWKSGAAMPTPRSGMAVIDYAGKIFAIGGEQRGMATAFTTNEAYDPGSNRWSEYAPLPEGRHGTSAAVIDGRICIPAGAPVPGGSRQSNTLLLYLLKMPPLTVQITD